MPLYFLSLVLLTKVLCAKVCPSLQFGCGLSVSPGTVMIAGSLHRMWPSGSLVCALRNEFSWDSLVVLRESCYKSEFGFTKLFPLGLPCDIPLFALHRAMYSGTTPNQEHCGFLDFQFPNLRAS